MKILLGLTLLLTTTQFDGCKPISCENNTVVAQIYADGYKVECHPAFPAPNVYVKAWTDHDSRTVYVWSDSLNADQTARINKLLWHEEGHIQAELRGLWFASQSDEERWADGYSWCKEHVDGIGYIIRPTDCTPFL